MREKLTSTWVCLLLGLISTPTFGAYSDHLLSLKSKFPYGLLGDDYGVLTINDMALNACHIKPEPFVSGAMTPYQYWQCFESKAISSACTDIGAIDREGMFGRVVVKAYVDQTMHKFIESRPWPLRDCRSFVKSLRQLMKGTSHACISASYIGNLKESDQKALIGIFHRIKTRKGYEGEDGKLTEKIRRDFCPDLQF